MRLSVITKIERFSIFRPHPGISDGCRNSRKTSAPYALHAGFEQTLFIRAFLSYSASTKRIRLMSYLVISYARLDFLDVIISNSISFYETSSFIQYNEISTPRIRLSSWRWGSIFFSGLKDVKALALCSSCIAFWGLILRESVLLSVIHQISNIRRTDGQYSTSARFNRLGSDGSRL